MECLVYIQVLGIDMKIHPRTMGLIVSIIISLLFYIPAKLFNWNLKVFFILGLLLSLIISLSLYDYFNNQYYLSNNDKDGDITDKDNIKKDNEE